MNILKEQFDKMGITPSRAARETGLSYLSVRRHLLGERVISAESAKKYEIAFGISRADLRPDLFGEIPPAKSTPTPDTHP